MTPDENNAPEDNQEESAGEADAWLIGNLQREVAELREELRNRRTEIKARDRRERSRVRLVLHELSKHDPELAAGIWKTFYKPYGVALPESYHPHRKTENGTFSKWAGLANERPEPKGPILGPRFGAVQLTPEAIIKKKAEREKWKQELNQEWLRKQEEQRKKDEEDSQ